MTRRALSEERLPSREAKSTLNVFVALLRGVNVGGNNMISMKSLRESFEELGFTHVTTYINSGNIIFTTKQSDARKLEKKIEQMLVKDYELDSKVVLRSLAEMEELVKSLPPGWNGDGSWKYNVIFLRHSIDTEEILKDLPVKSDIEEVVYRPGALLWSVQASMASQSSMVKLASRKMYRETTVRNLNTTRKLYELMKNVLTTKTQGTKVGKN